MTEEILEMISEPLLKWYDSDHRMLPWREDKTAYRVWVSEIMLQQTRVEAVKPYFNRFVDKFPDATTLAEAQEEILLKYWEGLGYYSRVRNMKKAAVIIKDKYDGMIPNDYKELLGLPGIGTYTAGAIASIAYNIPVAAVDGNVLRILSRVRMDEENISLPAVKKRVEQELNIIIPKDRSGDFNQAMMELGATICIPNGQAKCGECPWQEFCQARINDRVLEFPKKALKKDRVIEKKTVLILKDGERVAIHKRPSRGLLAGMYELPMFEGHLKEKEVLKRLKDIELDVLRIQSLEPAKHIFSHREWHMIGYAIRVDELQKMKEENAGFLFIDPKDTEDSYPIPTAFASYVKYVNIKLGNENFNKG